MYFFIIYFGWPVWPPGFCAKLLPLHTGETTTGLQANVFLIASYLYLSFWAVGAAILGQKHAGETCPFSKAICSLIGPFPKGTCFWLHPFSKVFGFWIPFFKGVFWVKPFLKGVVLPCSTLFQRFNPVLTLPF